MDNYLLNKGFERLKELNPDFEYQQWFFDRTLNMENVENRAFFKELNKTYELEKFQPIHIVGTFHVDYADKMWIEMLGALKRYNVNNIKAKGSLKAYINDRRAIRLCKFGGEYYIAEGNHRFCMAKFLNMTIDKVVVTEFEFDIEKHRNWTWFKDQQLIPVKMTEDFVLVKIQDTHVKIGNDILEPFKDYYSGLKRRNKWNVFFASKYPHFIKISSIADLKDKSLNQLIIKKRLPL